ncbi:membrane protease subunit [Rhizobium sp. YTUHZ044]|uniref:membrane protease subunit n=1 Tax=Rhizobium sp. YTUHZ044 TaxID=2962678 RepID=UPI003DA7B29C
MSDGLAVAAGIIVIGTLAFGGIGGCMYVAPMYNVYSQRMDGEAELAKAESNRQIKVREAQASFDASDLTAKAEIRRAEGVAQANKIIAEGLGGPEGYLRWRYIEMLENTGQKNGRDVIYIPTEAGLPVLEAGKRPEPTR